MSNLFTLPSQRAIDANTDALAGAKLYFYDPGTTDDRTVYSNRTLATPHAQPVVADAGGLFAPIYLPTGTYKVVLKDADDVTIFTADNVDGPLDTSTFLQDGDLVLDSPVVSKTTTYTVVAGDKGKIINANPTGGSFTITLLSAVTAGDGFPLTIRHVGTANQVTVEATTGQTIDGRVGISLTDQYQSITLTSDGANWHIVSDAPKFKETSPYFTVQDRLTAPPTSPTPGARYIITGTPTGAWSSYSEHDIVEATGTGAWVRIVPADGWQAFVDDEDTQYQLRAGAWVAWSNITAPDPTNLEVAVFELQKSNGTVGGAATTGSWRDDSLASWVETKNTISGCSMASGLITLPAGTFVVVYTRALYRTNNSQIQIVSTTTSTKVRSLSTYTEQASNVGVQITATGVLTLSAQEIFKPQYLVNFAGDTNALGFPHSTISDTEIYGTIQIIDLGSLQGPTGEQGLQGNTGAGYAGASTTSLAIGTGSKAFTVASGLAYSAGARIRAASAADPTVDYMEGVVTAYSGTTLTVTIDLAQGSGTHADWTINLAGDQGASGVVWEGAWQTSTAYVVGDSVSNSGSAYICTSNHTSGASTEPGTGASWATVWDVLAAKGATGATGATGAAGPTVAIGFNYSTTTADAAPGSGIFRLNNATLASVTEAYFDNNERGGTDVSAWLDSFDDSGESTYRGLLLLIDTADSTEFQLYKVTGSVTDGTGYRKVSLTWIAGKAAGSFTTGGEIAVSFAARGASGAGDMDSVTYDPAGVSEQLVGLTATQTLTNKTLTQPVLTLEQGASVAPTAEGRIAWDTDDNKLKVGDGASTKTFSDDSVNAAAYQPLDADLTAIAALAVTDGNFIVGNGSAWVAESGATARTSLGLAIGTDVQAYDAGLADIAGLAVADGNVIVGDGANWVAESGATARTSLGLGTGDSPQFTGIELGHATDTTLTRSAAGEVAIEGVLVKKVGRETIWIPAAAMTARTTNGAASGTSELATNDVMLTTFDFDQTTEEGVGFFVAMPKSWNESTVTFVPYWTAASGSGGVVFGLAAYAFSNDDALDTAVSGQQTSTDTLIAANDCHVGPESSAITIGGTPATNDLVYFEITREVANGSDTLTADAKLIGIHLYITTDASTDT